MKNKTKAVKSFGFFVSNLFFDANTSDNSGKSLLKYRKFKLFLFIH